MATEIPINEGIISSASPIFEHNIDTLTVAHWNIGHFSLGTQDSSSILTEDADSVAALFHVILDTLAVDIFGLCEYSSVFTRADTQTLLFSNFPFLCQGRKYAYNFNVVYSKIIPNKAKEIIFNKRVQNRYYLEVEFIINGKTVYFIETHLDWNQGGNGAECRNAQMRQLAETFSQNEYVIICADFNNSSDMSEFDVFKENGFKMVNDGSLHTYPAKNPTNPCDNILYRGFDLLNCDVITDPTLSDHCILRSRFRID